MSGNLTTLSAKLARLGSGPRYFKLRDDHSVEPVGDVIEWARWFEKTNRHVAQTTVGDLLISTVFLGLDHSFGEPTPLLFETMVFGENSKARDLSCERYSTWDEAVAGHARAVLAAQQGVV